MRIKESEALEIATKFALLEFKDINLSKYIDDSELAIDINTIRIRQEFGGFFAKYLEVSEKHWSVCISTASRDPNVATIDPGLISILVDSITGKAKLVPVM